MASERPSISAEGRGHLRMESRDRRVHLLLDHYLWTEARIAELQEQVRALEVERDLWRFGENRAWAIVDALGATPTPPPAPAAHVWEPIHGILACSRCGLRPVVGGPLPRCPGPAAAAPVAQGAAHGEQPEDPVEAAIVAAIEADGEAYDRAMAQLPDDSVDPNHVCTPYGCCCSGCGREVQTDG